MNKMHTVKRAIIMAAGLGKRMQPLTLEIPKPLVKVNGVRMIDTVVDGLRKNGITEIYVVVGYKKEAFYKWAVDQNDIELIENPYYETCNNISSLYVAREHLADCIIVDGDQIIYNSEVLTAEFSLSGYNVVWCDRMTEEWLLQAENGVIMSCSRNGGMHGWQLYSISRWCAEDGEKLREHLEYEFERGNCDIYWDDVAMFCHFNDYTLGIYEMKAKDVVEIDDLEELAVIDSDYKEYLEKEK